MRQTIKVLIRLTGTTLVVFGLLQASALAGIYKWKDDQGKLHFTDSKSKVPMKYRNQLQKFKGVNETTIVTAPDAKKEGKQAAADSKTGDKSGEKPDKKTEPEKEKVAKKEGPDMDPNLMQALKKARDYLETENNALLQVFNRPFSERIAEKYIPTIEKLISQKEAAFGELEGYDQPSIRKARQFIGQSLIQDRELVEDQDTSSEFLRELRTRVLNEAEMKKEIIAEVKSDLPEDEAENVDEKTMKDRIFGGVLNK